MEIINEQIASDYLEIHYMEIKEEIHELSENKNFAGIFQAIVNNINLLLTKRQTEKIGNRIKLIGWLYKRGNEYVRYIIENLFVRSFTGMQKRYNDRQWTYMYQLIPNNLKHIHQLQYKTI